MRDSFPWLTQIGDATQFTDRLPGVADRVGLLDAFDPKDAWQLASRMPCYRAPAGSVLIGEGDAGDFGLFLLGGKSAYSNATGAERRAASAKPFRATSSAKCP